MCGTFTWSTWKNQQIWDFREEPAKLLGTAPEFVRFCGAKIPLEAGRTFVSLLAMAQTRQAESPA